jgi:hypothetical protein
MNKWIQLYYVSNAKLYNDNKTIHFVLLYFWKLGYVPV